MLYGVYTYIYTQYTYHTHTHIYMCMQIHVRFIGVKNQQYIGGTTMKQIRRCTTDLYAKPVQLEVVGKNSLYSGVPQISWFKTAFPMWHEIKLIKLIPLIAGIWIAHVWNVCFACCRFFGPVGYGRQNRAASRAKTCERHRFMPQVYIMDS